MILYVGLIVTSLAGVLSLRYINIEEGESCLLQSAQYGQCRKILDCPNLDYDDTASLTFCKPAVFSQVVCCPSQKGEATRTVQAMCEAIPQHIPRTDCDFCSDYYQDEFPFMGLLVDNLRTGDTMNCGAVLITSKLLLTAAHCFGVRDPDNIQVLLGTNSAIDYNENLYETSRIILHPKYTRRNHDIAIVELSEEVDTRFFTPLCIYDSTEDLNTDENLTVLGWHERNRYFMSNDYLQKAAMKPVLHSTCKAKIDGTNFNVTDGHQCAEIVYSNPATCANFYGGPLVKRVDDKYYLIGIISKHFFSCTDKPKVYTRVASYLDWITEQIKALGNLDAKNNSENSVLIFQ